MILKSEKVNKFLSDLEDEYDKIEMGYNRVVDDGVQEELKLTLTDINNKQYEITLKKGLAKTKVDGDIKDYKEAVVVSNVKCITEMERIREHIRITNSEFNKQSEIVFLIEIDEIIRFNVEVYFEFYKNEDDDNAFSDEVGEPNLKEKYEFQDTKNLLKIIYKNFNRELKEVHF